jgi:hypothetical protein
VEAIGGQLKIEVYQCAHTLRSMTGGDVARRFPLPWSVEELDVCFVVRDPGGH